MITIILLTFLSMTVLLMGFMDIKLPFVTNGSQQHNHNGRIRGNERISNSPSSSSPTNQPQKYLHYTSPANRGIFPVSSSEPEPSRTAG